MQPGSRRTRIGHLQRHCRQRVALGQQRNDLPVDLLVLLGIVLLAQQQHISGQQRVDPSSGYQQCITGQIVQNRRLRLAGATADKSGDDKAEK